VDAAIPQFLQYLGFEDVSLQMRILILHRVSFRLKVLCAKFRAASEQIPQLLEEPFVSDAVALDALDLHF
jgi:hypothetical protein